MLSPKLRDLFGTHGQLPPAEFPAPLFITGCMRSGTTFLVNKVTHHPQLLKIGSELNEIWTAIGGASCQGECEYRGEEHGDFVALANMVHYFDRFIEASKSTKRHLMRAQHKYLQKLETRVGYDWDRIIPVNKSPHLMNKIGYIHRLFPKSPVVLIVRDIFAQCASMKVHFDNDFQRDGRVNFIPTDPKGCWSRYPQDQVPEAYQGAPHYPGDFGLLPEMWIRLNAQALASIEALPADKRVVICYEDLIQRQAAGMEQVFAALPLDARHAEAARDIAAHQTTVINTTTKGNPLEKWRKQLSGEEIGAIEAAVARSQVTYDRIQADLERLKLKF